MIFVVGGRNQGKEALARRLCKINRSMAEKKRDSMEKEQAEQEDAIAVADGRYDTPEVFLHADLILHYEALVRRLMEEISPIAPCEFTERLLFKNPGAVITADEIGCGVVPADAFEREYRETAGRICQRIAGASEAVYRVICGIETRIK